MANYGNSQYGNLGKYSYSDGNYESESNYGYCMEQFPTKTGFSGLNDPARPRCFGQRSYPNLIDSEPSWELDHGPGLDYGHNSSYSVSSNFSSQNYGSSAEVNVNHGYCMEQYPERKGMSTFGGAVGPFEQGSRVNLTTRQPLLHKSSLVCI